MKKFLAILVLGLLLLSGCTTARQEIAKGGIHQGISKSTLKNELGATAPSEDAFMGGCYRQYYPNLRFEVLSSQSRSVYYIFERVYEPSVGCSRSIVGDGRLAVIKYSRHDVEKYINLKVSKKAEELKKEKTQKKEEETKKEEDQLVEEKKEKDEEKTEKKEADDDWF